MRAQTIIDLSVPYNGETSGTITPQYPPRQRLDELSRIKDATLQHRREAEVPRPLAIIQHHIDEFAVWHDMRRHVPVLKADSKPALTKCTTCQLYIRYSLETPAAPRTA